MVRMTERALPGNDYSMFGLGDKLVITDSMSGLGQTIVPKPEQLFSLSALSAGLPGVMQIPAANLMFNQPKLDLRMSGLGQTAATPGEKRAVGTMMMGGGLISGTLNALMLGFLIRNIGHESNTFWKVIGYVGLASSALGVFGSLAAVLGGMTVAAAAPAQATTPAVPTPVMV